MAQKIYGTAAVVQDIMLFASKARLQNIIIYINVNPAASNYHGYTRIRGHTTQYQRTNVYSNSSTLPEGLGRSWNACKRFSPDAEVIQILGDIAQGEK